MGMTNKEATHKLEYSKKAYQMLIDEKVDSGKFVGKDVEGEWKADTPLDEAYKSMIEALDLAIQALEQQPSEDCVSREDVINAIESEDKLSFMGVFCSHDCAMGFRETIKELPSVTPQQTRWIPVSERLPNNYEYMKNNGMFNVSDGDRSYSEWFDPDKQMFGEPTMTGFRVDYAVIAWMPLPEPYMAESEE